MKILIITGIFPPDIGGPASYVPKISKEFTDRGHKVQVLCLSDEINHDDRQYPFKVLRIKRSLFKPYRWLKTIASIFRMTRNADLVYVNGLYFESMLATKFSKKPVVHKIVGDRSWERARNRGWFKGTIDEYQIAEKNLLLRITDLVKMIPLRKAKAIIVPSLYLKGIVKSWGIPEKIINVVYNSVESSLDNEGINLPEYNGHTVITVCRLVPWKGVADLIDAVSELENTRLVICGDGPMRNELEQLAEKNCIKERVLFLGHLHKKYIKGYLQQGECFVLNSSYEGLPHVALEALDVGIPTVATDAGGTGEVVISNYNGILIPAGDKNALKAAILKVLSDKANSERLQKNGKETILSKFSYKNMIDQTEKVLIQTVNNFE